MSMAMKSRRAFTLIELLLTIGAIGLLAALLLPMVGRAREQGKQIYCLNNLRQLSMATILYSRDNRGFFPQEPTFNNYHYNDWIYWGGGRDISRSAIARYLAQPVTDATFRCPSDEIDYRAYKTNNYLYSYSMVDLMNQFNTYSIRNPVDKVFMYEEDERTIDDGHSSPEVNQYIDLLAIRHDPSAHSVEQEASNPLLGLSLNGSCRGNAAFCDGHAEYITRLLLHTPATYDPNY
jgi:prepilin-type N-terminal cleavage/methylation domain-containing protein/prepilin-type processing-associated H-X9-DG protein